MAKTSGDTDTQKTIESKEAEINGLRLLLKDLTGPQPYWRRKARQIAPIILALIGFVASTSGTFLAAQIDPDVPIEAVREVLNGDEQLQDRITELEAAIAAITNGEIVTASPPSLIYVDYDGDDRIDAIRNPQPDGSSTFDFIPQKEASPAWALIGPFLSAAAVIYVAVINLRGSNTNAEWDKRLKVLEGATERTVAGDE